MTGERTVHVTEGLVDALLELAAERDPDSVNAALSVTRAGDLDGAAQLDPDTPVFTDLYLPNDRRSINAVFGVDVTIPPRQSQGRFISHPEGMLDVSIEDDLHEVMLVAVPPWERDSIAVYDRRGRTPRLAVLDAVPPVERLDER